MLIVLGMFAFMLVSAVSFSIYMRSSRAPSSYVRRNASARHLVKAALARAIDEIDTAIGNDPFPGVGYNHDYNSSDFGHLNDQKKVKNDNWHGRVFTPSNEVAHADTVSTLTLEALGYLPPCLVNEVRYWSRHTRTAKWHSFNYGLGQYAFTAVNVSDFFDLNQFIDLDGVAKQRLNRSSSEHGRISPTYLFRGLNTADMDTGGNLASAFLAAMKDGSAFGVTPSLTEVPFVSMMDFNLALGTELLGGVASPFMKRLNGSTGRFYDSVSEDVVRRQVFMAGGWNGDSNLTYQAYNSVYGGEKGRINLQYPDFQPFSGCQWFPANTSLYDCYRNINPENHPFWSPVKCDFPALSIALLCDYLDYDNVPLSLCMPCTEAVPMLCGVELTSDVKYQMNVQPDVELVPANPQTGTNKKIKRTYSLKVDVNQLKVAVDAVYPFINGPQGQNADYTAEAFARIFLTAESDNADDNLADAGLRAPGTGLASVAKDQWDWSGTTDAKYIQVTMGDKSLSARAANGGDVNGAEQDAIQNLQMSMSGGNLSKDAPLVDLVYEVDGDGKETLLPDECVGYVNFMFFDNWTAWDGNKVLDCFKTDKCAATFRPSVAVWVRIKNSAGKTVDMVPAVPSNDILIDSGKESVYDRNKGLPEFDLAMGGTAGDPLLRFFPKKTDNGIVLTTTHFKNSNGDRPVEWKQKSYIANDPRINWAPEHWWATAESKDPGKMWLDNVRNFQDGNNWCDQDIFMSVSDQGYMQSVYEWLFIPQVLRIRKDASNYETTRYTTKEMLWGCFNGGNGYDGVVNTSVGDVQHRDIMWRTHRSTAFMKEGQDPETWDWGLVDKLPFDDSDTGLRVNPYTDSIDVMLGAFANMPHDWWAASTNQYALGKNYMAPGSSFNSDYLFDWSCNYQDVYNMAYYWMGAFKRWDESNKEERGKLFYQSDYWKDVFEDAVFWYDGRKAYDVPIMTSDNTTLNSGILNDSTVEPILKDLTMADRKFLYGYLRGCFANTHQLFLIFVRAESAAGGGGAGSGARAVALVWRDPNAPMKNGLFATADGGTESPLYGKDNAQAYLNLQNDANEESWRLNARKYPPHKTRILFYHQLD